MRVRGPSDDRAVQNGANTLAESFLFAVGAGLVLGETYRSSRKNAERRDNVAEDIATLKKELAELKGKEGNEIEELRTMWVAGGALTTAPMLGIKGWRRRCLPSLRMGSRLGGRGWDIMKGRSRISWESCRVSRWRCGRRMGVRGLRRSQWRQSQCSRRRHSISIGAPPEISRQLGQLGPLSHCNLIIICIIYTLHLRLPLARQHSTHLPEREKKVLRTQICANDMATIAVHSSTVNQNNLLWVDSTVE